MGWASCPIIRRRTFDPGEDERSAGESTPATAAEKRFLETIGADHDDPTLKGSSRVGHVVAEVARQACSSHQQNGE
jgi:hypothetical protein